MCSSCIAAGGPYPGGAYPAYTPVASYPVGAPRAKSAARAKAVVVQAAVAGQPWDAQRGEGKVAQAINVSSAVAVAQPAKKLAGKRKSAPSSLESGAGSEGEQKMDGADGDEGKDERKRKPRNVRRRVTDIPANQLWFCPKGCGKAYTRTSTVSAVFRMQPSHLCVRAYVRRVNAFALGVFCKRLTCTCFCVIFLRRLPSERTWHCLAASLRRWRRRKASNPTSSGHSSSRNCSSDSSSSCFNSK